jgi:amidase
LKIGLDPDFGLNDVAPPMRAVMNDTVATLRGLGATLVTVRFPDRAEVIENLLTIAGQESIDYKDPVAATASRPEPALYRKAVAWRERFSREVAGLLSRIDVLLTPAVPEAVMPVAGMEKLESDPVLFRKTLRYVVPFDLAGSPALVLPAGTNDAGGPVGVQFVAQRYREDVLLQTAYAFEQATQWHVRRPPAALGSNPPATPGSAP